MAKKAYVRNSENTEWVEIASSVADLSGYLTQSSASTTYATKTGGTFTGNITAPEVRATTKLVAQTVGGDEGGEILLGKAATNTTLTGDGVTIDVYQNRLRIFEQGGDARGGYIDVSTLGNGVSTNLTPGLVQIIPLSVSVGSGSGTVAAGGAVTFSGASLINLDNVFTSNYQNYKILVNVTANTVSGGAGINWRGRTSGSTVATGYGSQFLRGSSTTANAFTIGDAAVGGIASAYATYGQFEFILNSPQIAQVTTATSVNNYVNGAGTGASQVITSWHNSNNQFDGLSVFVDSGTFSGTIRIYGYNNGGA